MKNEWRKKNNKFIQTYLYGESGNYFISTAYRPSSAMVNSPPWYYETIAWELNDDGHRGEMVEMEDSGSGENVALKKHYELVKKLKELNK